MHLTKDLIRAFEETGMLVKKRPTGFGNVDSFPWIDLSIAQTVNGNFSIFDDSNCDQANLITVVTSKTFDQAIYHELLIELSKKLNWELVLEEDDDGNEEVIIWTSSGKRII